ncbi:MAG: hypothetical protein A7315_10980 [Candidatus Altiarchaeales archaeon WOR_SM1_79]|nr:MAG: hypothetical protein A7315_10980 [Candidatus Altiarchaeales archaeon WOR_SM1_79]
MNILKLKNVLNNIDPKLTGVFLPWALRHPRYIQTFIRLVRSHEQTKKLREDEKSKGILVPPFLIISITSRCNLFCAGCYAAAAGTVHHKKGSKEQQLNREQWKAIISEASELGVFGFVIAGGEPFLYPGLLELCKEFKDRFFLIVTNGTALKETDFEILKHSSNIAVIVSVEGTREITNARRGQCVYEKATSTLERICKIGVLTGISAAITRHNYKYWMDDGQLDRFISQGIRVGVFIEYIPATNGVNSSSNDHSLMLTKEERSMFRSQMFNYRAAKPIYIIHSPGDEEFFGGCVSAGRGFAHVTPEGDLTACPVSNIATHNLRKSTLREGLDSSLFKEIRENEHLLETEGMPCALFAHPKEMDELAKAVGAYRTDIKER